jgi:alkylation response protein AidB-like acyl-CoA dehydrogenase
VSHLAEALDVPDAVCPEVARCLDGPPGHGPAATTPAAIAVEMRRWFGRVGSALDPARAIPSASLEEVVAVGRDLQRLLWDEGWLRLGWPELCGGLGGGPMLRAAVYEALTLERITLPETFPMIETVGNMVLAFAPETASTALPQFLRGDEIWSQGFSEPEAGSDLASLRTSVRDEGDHFVLNGQKTWTTMGQFCCRSVILARSGERSAGHRALTMLLVDMDAEGVVVSPLTAATGRVEFAELFFSEVRVPKSALIGSVGNGWDVAMYGLQWERGMYAWQRQGWMHSRLEQLLRLTADAPPLPAADLAALFEGLVGLRLVARATLKTLSAGDNPGPLISVDKLLLSSVEQRLFDLAREALSPRIELGDDAESRSWRQDFLYSRVASVYGGSAQIQRNIIAERLLGMPRETRG